MVTAITPHDVILTEKFDYILILSLPWSQIKIVKFSFLILPTASMHDTSLGRREHSKQSDCLDLVTYYSFFLLYRTENGCNADETIVFNLWYERHRAVI